MLKKVLISAIIATAVFAAGSAVYAQSESNYARNGRDIEPVFDLHSDKEETKTFSKEYVVSGNAKEGTKVTISVYWFSADDEKSIIANKKQSENSEKEGKWILQQADEFTVGASGMFAETVALNLGKNRIVLFIIDKEENTGEKVLEIERSLEKEVREEVNGNSLNRLVEDMSSNTGKDK